MSQRNRFDVDAAFQAGAQVLARARQVTEVLRGTPNPPPTGGNTTRFVPPPLQKSGDETESDATWGFADTRFAVDPNGQVVLTGKRYSLAGEPLPNLLPWIRQVMESDLPVEDVHAWSFPPPIPAAVRNERFLKDLAGFAQAEQWSEDPVVRLRHGHGHTQEEMYALKYGKIERVPDVVFWPTSEEQVDKLVQAAGRHGVVLIPYGGGTNVTDALRCPEHEQRTIVSVDMRRMNAIRWIDPVNRMACIEAGAVGRHIVEQLGQHGFTMGHEPDSIEFSTLGGWVATHASGMKKNRYGNIEDIVLDVTVYTAAGKLTRTPTGRTSDSIAPRESVGIDPRLWLFGSEGKLGIITSAVVKLFPLPEVQHYGSVLFPDFETGVAFMYDLAQSGQPPASVRLVDNMQFQFSMALKPASKGWKVQKSKLEKLFVTKLKGFDPLKMTACTLVFEGSRREVEQQEELLYGLAKKHGGMAAGGENGARGYQLTFGIAYIRDFVMDHWVLAESFETSVPWSQCLSLCENVKKRLYDECAQRGIPGKPFVTCRVTQVYDTGVAVYFYFAFAYKGVENPTQVYLDIERAARDEVLRQGGSLSHHHGIGKLRQEFLPQIASGALLDWQRDMKRAIDPDDIFGCANQSVAKGLEHASEAGDVKSAKAGSPRGVA
jgi:alkyldihydroxyacetonephosphate synthase